MALNSAASGAQTAVTGVEHALATITSAGVYIVTVDLAQLANGERVTIQIKTRTRSADTTRLYARVYASHALADPIFKSVPVPSGHELVVTLQQDGGSGRTFPWDISSV